MTTNHKLYSFTNKYYHLLLLILLIGDIIFSYYQFSLFTIDGDVPRIAVPEKSYLGVLADPFGFNILKTGEMHAGSNRYFAHITEYYYMREAPIFFQHFVSPIDSIYLSAAIAKTIIQTATILLLAAYISIPFGLKKKRIHSWGHFGSSIVSSCRFL
jgi:hypothetical protein